jgi:hypothetical protein
MAVCGSGCGGRHGDGVSRTCYAGGGNCEERSLRGVCRACAVACRSRHKTDSCVRTKASGVRGRVGRRTSECCGVVARCRVGVSLAEGECE